MREEVQGNNTNRDFWKTSNPLSSYNFKVFTDGSKTPNGCGAGFHVQDTSCRGSFRLPDTSTVFQGEVFAITMACQNILNWHSNDLMILDNASMVIYVDSQAAIKALSSFRTTSSLIKECKGMLNNLGSLCDLTIMWVPGHTNIQGNEDADLLLGG
ncbi:ribonuclease H family protein [Streptomyces sp. IBSBF 2390]|uniref:ribonuclease H family protein n=1 Tax=Streptomyces sp. IBSBF 2390 TaxID=2903533 RepID=UPI003FA79A80